MSVRFRPTATDVDDEQGADVTADALTLQKQFCTAEDKAISAAALVASDIPGEQGKRIRQVIAIADRMDCHRTTSLWYYNRAVAFEYFTWRNTDERRKVMTSATGGQMPFDGHMLNKGAWRLYPFKELVRLYGVGDRGFGNLQIKNWLEALDFEIFKTFADIEAELGQNGVAIDELNKFPKGARSMYGLAEPFLKHLNQLQRTPDHLYSAYK
jgi:hypothetical protein